MTGQTSTLTAKLRQRSAPISVGLGKQSKLTPVFFRLIMLVALCWLALVSGELFIARLAPLLPMMSLPQQYLPGNLPPSEMTCESSADSVPHCFVNFQDQRVQFDFDTDTRTIVRAIIPAEHYTIGQLVVSWGTPRGINRNQSTIYVYWQSHFAIIDSTSLRPDSPVKSIMYDLEQPPMSPWHGFQG